MMKKFYKYAVCILCLLIGAAIGVSLKIGHESPICMALNSEFDVEGTMVTLSEGKACGEAWSLETTLLPAVGDLTGDGKEDASLILHYEDTNGLSRNYLAAAQNSGRSMKGSVAVYLGDGVFVVKAEISSQMIWVTLITSSGGEETQQFALQDGSLVKMG